ncbi:MAG: sensor histidine kinase, partial [Anaerolineales bacterium]
MSDVRPDPSTGRDPTLLAFSQAALAITSELSLEHVLKRILDSARQLSQARYAALGVFHPDGRLAQFVFSGVTTEESEAIGACPTGLGLLRAIVTERRTLRVPDIRSDHRSSGFPPGHPPMTSFLGVPIMIGGEVLGNLYLTDKQGAAEFSSADADRIEILAAHAALALRNAQLFQATVERGHELEARNKELAALNVVAKAASNYLQLPDMLAAVLDEVLAVADAEAGEILLREEPSGDMVLTLHRGEAAQAFHGIIRFPPGQGYPGKVAETGQALAIQDPSSDALLRREVMQAGFHAFAYIPLRARNEVIGVLGLGTRQPRRFNEREMGLLEAIGHQIGVAVENARLYNQVGRMAVSEERSRIGMDLHDGVIQSIYAVGLTLEAARHLLPEDRERATSMIEQAVSGLNDAIRDIRNFILDLRPRRFEGDLGQGLARLVREFQANTMVQARLHAPSAAVNGLPTAVARTIFLTTQEALANVARHARAMRVDLRLMREHGRLALTIEDDGVG